MKPLKPWVKICGITSIEDAHVAISSGADAIGLNFVRGSRRYVEPELGRRIAAAVRGRIEIIGVFADESLERLAQTRAELSLDWLQLHGAEPPELVQRLPRSFKAMRVGSRDDVERGFAYPGDRVLLDAKVEGTLGGTGAAFDWDFIPEGAPKVRLILAGGLTPLNVRTAIERVRPFGVDVASGVESEFDPRKKDSDKVAAFIAAARGAA